MADERIITELASRQRGVVSVAQLHAAGFDDSAIRRRHRTGRLHRMYHGVYLVGHAVAPDGAAEFGAILACGQGALISHRSAARLRDLSAFRTWRGPIEITVPGRRPARKPGLVVHRSDALEPADRGLVGGIPVTSASRTLLDLATVMTAFDLEIVLAEMRARGFVRDEERAELLGRCGRRRGARALRRGLELDRGQGLTRSKAERVFHAWLREAGLPLPVCNAYVGRIQVDFWWPDAKLVVEVDGYAHHSDRVAFEKDRDRDSRLAAAGNSVMRITWRQLTARPVAVIARIAAALARRS